MEDYVQLLNYLKMLNPELNGRATILFGGSYGGMLAAWMRIKYPNHFQGAVASSAPILQFKGKTNPNAYSEFASNVYKEAGGQECYDSIKYGFYDLTNLKWDPNYYTTLRDKF